METRSMSASSAPDARVLSSTRRPTTGPPTRNTHRRAEEGLRLASRLPRARLCRRFPSHRDRGARRLSDWRGEVLRLAATSSTSSGSAEGELHHRPAEAPSRRGRLFATPSSRRRRIRPNLCAFRVCFPRSASSSAPRESKALRNALFPLASPRSAPQPHTEPGGYTGEGADDVHLTVRAAGSSSMSRLRVPLVAAPPPRPASSTSPTAVPPPPKSRTTSAPSDWNRSGRTGTPPFFSPTTELPQLAPVA